MSSSKGWRGAADDPSRGYEAVAEAFISNRERLNVGATTVARWARGLPARSAVIDLGCGSGVPVTKTLLDAGHTVYAIDASASMLRVFRDRFPKVPAACESIQQSRFFDRTFDAAIAWGVMFLLSRSVQQDVIVKVSHAVKPGGRFLFTAPSQVCTWADLLTGGESTSLGSETYARLLSSAEFTLVREFDDEGENHYFEAVRH